MDWEWGYVFSTLALVVFVGIIVAGLIMNAIDKKKKRGNYAPPPPTEEEIRQQQTQEALAREAETGLSELKELELGLLLRHYHKTSEADFDRIYEEYCRRFTKDMMRYVDHARDSEERLKWYLRYLVGGPRVGLDACSIFSQPDLDLVMQRAAELVVQEKQADTAPVDCIGLFLLELARELKRARYCDFSKKNLDDWDKSSRLSGLRESSVSAVQYMGFVSDDDRPDETRKRLLANKDYISSQMNIESSRDSESAFYWAKADRKMRMKALPDEASALLKTVLSQKAEDEKVAARKRNTLRMDSRVAVRSYSYGEVEQARQTAKTAAEAGFDAARLFLLRDAVMHGDVTAADKLPEFRSQTEELQSLLARAAKSDVQAMMALGEDCLKHAGKRNVTLEQAAMEWFAGAARCGCAEGWLRMGALYEKGKTGLKADLPVAAELYLRAAEKLQNAFAWMEYARVAEGERILEAYYNATRTTPATPEDHKLIQEAWRWIAIGFVYNSTTKEKELFHFEYHMSDLLTGKLKRAGSAEKDHPYLLYGHTLDGVAGYTLRYLGKDRMIEGRTAAEWVRAVAAGDADAAHALGREVRRHMKAVSKETYDELYAIEKCWDEAAMHCNMYKALKGDHAARVSVAEFYLWSPGWGDEVVKEGIRWLAPELKAENGQAFWLLADRGKFFGLSDQEVVDYYNKAAARGVESAIADRDLFLAARKAEEDLERWQRKQERKAYLAAIEREERRTREENEARLNKFEREMNEFRYGRYATNEEMGLQLGFDDAAMAHLDDIHRETLKHMERD